ncbi:hypothetical protein ASE00_01875 [Sphingomonas sp. Root710]|nr:hypothetical protein ASE00_01875 [Sphingomonas sp. Root710]
MPPPKPNEAEKKTKPTRRRGAALEKVLLEVAWEQLAAVGYRNFTMEAVADGARTSRSVIYRRWASRAELASAAIASHLAQDPIEMPDLGCLRDELLCVLQQSMDRGAFTAGVMARDMVDIYRETGTTPAALREAIMGTEGELLNRMIERAISRGELSGEGLTPRIISLARDLLRHEQFMTMSPPPHSVIVEILDDIVMPLLTRRS